MEQEEVDEDLRDAIKECSKIIEEKCKKRPYMIILSKADIKFDSEEEKKKGVAKGKASFIYVARPPLRKSGLSKILLGASKKALELAEKRIHESK
ncbi:hypothetical protein GF318_02790 [Candidatus Micrarchaeota archaeon]|nr:hypothetical protein [Candidatus Micrarchaeota archaeon]